MPICSTPRHSLPYQSSADEAEKLADIGKLLHTIRSTRVSQRFKKMMLDRVVWLVVESTGNFYSRFRSEGVVSSVGKRIQRDHIYTRKALVAELLGDAVDVEQIIGRAQCCVVTHEEHAALSRTPRQFQGWDRYRHAEPPVMVHDMLTGNRLT